MSNSLNWVPPGYGQISVLTIANPAVATQFKFDPPTNYRCRMLGMRFTLTADINVANRQVYLDFYYTTTRIFRIHSDQLQPASTAWLYSISPGGQIPKTNSFGSMEIPWEYMIPFNDLCSLLVFGNAIQAGDQFSDIRVLYEGWASSL